jgi:HK97 family phage portal protein
VSILRRGIESRNGFPVYGTHTNPLTQLYGTTSIFSTAGERVDEFTALGVSTVLACTSLLADSVATMPLKVVRDGKVIPTPPVLADPDPTESTQFETIHSIVISLALHGNAYVHIERDSSGAPIGLTPLHPYQVNVMPDKQYTGRQYLYLGNEIPREDMLHIRWYTSPQSLTGISPLLQQRTMIGLNLAVDKYLAQWYGEGGTPSGVLSTDKSLTSEAAKNLRETWEASTRKHRRPAVLSDGLKWQAVQQSAVDMEFNDTRAAIISEVARIFRVPGYLLGIKGDGQTYQNVELASLSFLTYTLQPWLTRLEIAFSKILEPGTQARFDPSSLLRLDASTKANVSRTLIGSGQRTSNEMRLLDGYEPYAGGDRFIQVFPGAGVDPAAIGQDSTLDPAAGLV